LMASKAAEEGNLSVGMRQRQSGGLEIRADW
jgi:hypothetical protein